MIIGREKLKDCKCKTCGKELLEEEMFHWRGLVYCEECADEKFTLSYLFAY